MSVRFRGVGLAPRDPPCMYCMTNKSDRIYMVDMLDRIHMINRIVFCSVVSIL